MRSASKKDPKDTIKVVFMDKPTDKEFAEISRDIKSKFGSSVDIVSKKEIKNISKGREVKTMTIDDFMDDVEFKDHKTEEHTTKDQLKSKSKTDSKEFVTPKSVTPKVSTKSKKTPVYTDKSIFSKLDSISDIVLKQIADNRIERINKHILKQLESKKLESKQSKSKKSKSKPKPNKSNTKLIDITLDGDKSNAEDMFTLDDLSKAVLLPVMNIKLTDHQEIFRQTRIASVYNRFVDKYIKYDDKGKEINPALCLIFETIKQLIDYIIEQQIDKDVENKLIPVLEHYIGKSLSAMSNEAYVTFHDLLLDLVNFENITVMYIDDICLYPKYMYASNMVLDEENLKLIDWKKDSWCYSESVNYPVKVYSKFKEDGKVVDEKVNVLSKEIKLISLVIGPGQYPETNTHLNLDCLPCVFRLNEVFNDNSTIDPSTGEMDFITYASARQKDKIYIFEVKPISDYLPMIIKFVSIYKCTKVAFPGFYKPAQPYKAVYDFILYSIDFNIMLDYAGSLVGKIKQDNIEQEHKCHKCGSNLSYFDKFSCSLTKCNKEEQVERNEQHLDDFIAMNEFWKTHKLPNIDHESIRFKVHDPTGFSFVSVIALNYIKLMIAIHEVNSKIKSDYSVTQMSVAGGEPSLISKASVFKYSSKKFSMKIVDVEFSSLMKHIKINLKRFHELNSKSENESETLTNCAFIQDHLMGHKLMVRMYSQTMDNVKGNKIKSAKEFILRNVQEFKEKESENCCLFDKGFLGNDCLVLAPEFSHDYSTNPFIIQYHLGYKMIPSIMYNAGDTIQDKTQKFITAKKNNRYNM